MSILISRLLKSIDVVSLSSRQSVKGKDGLTNWSKWSNRAYHSIYLVVKIKSNDGLIDWQKRSVLFPFGGDDHSINIFKI